MVSDNVDNPLIELIAFGMVPSNLFPPISRFTSLERDPKKVGSVPKKLLELTFSCVSDVIVIIADGSAPFRLLLFTFRLRSCDNKPIWIGIVPFKRL